VQPPAVSPRQNSEANNKDMGNNAPPTATSAEDPGNRRRSLGVMEKIQRMQAENNAVMASSPDIKYKSFGSEDLKTIETAVKQRKAIDVPVRIHKRKIDIFLGPHH